MKDFKQGELVEKVWYELTFDDGRNNGFSFPCDKNGKVSDDINDAAKKNYEYALAHPEKFVRYNKVVEWKQEYRENNSGTCDCGETIELYNEYLGGCECPNCGRWWNIWGQRLNNPDTWSDGDEL